MKNKQNNQDSIAWYLFLAAVAGVVGLFLMGYGLSVEQALTLPTLPATPTVSLSALLPPVVAADVPTLTVAVSCDGYRGTSGEWTVCR